MEYLGWFFGLLGLLIIVFVFINMLMRFKLVGIYPCNDQEIPENIQMLLLPGVNSVESMGFKKQHAQKQFQQINQDEMTIWQLVFYHPEHRMYAIVSTPFNKGHREAYEIIFQSIYDFPRQLISTNNYMHILTTNVEGLRIEDLYTDDIVKTFEHHVRLIADIHEQSKHLEASEYIDHDLKWAAHEMSETVKNGMMRRHKDGSLSFTFLGTLKQFYRQFAGESKAGQHKNGTTRPVDHLSETTKKDKPAGIQHDLAMYQHRKSSQDATLGMWGKLGLFFASLILFALAFGLTLGTQTMVIILAVLLLHEGGHLAAMYLLGYRDLQVLFIPFLGAAAMSKKPQFSTVKSFIVSLMGPLPGIILGLYLLWYPDPSWPEWTIDLAYMLLFLNILNILPIMPLDGGQIMNELLFFRHPRVQTLFIGFSTLLFILAALSLGGTLWIIAIFSLLVSYNIYKQAMFRRAFFKEHRDDPNESNESYLQKIFEFFQKETYRTFSANRKFDYAEHLINHRMIRPIGAGVVMLLLSIYAVSLIAPPVLIVKHLFSPMTAISYDDYNMSADESNYMKEMQASWDKKIAAATDEQSRQKLLMQAGTEFCNYDSNHSKRYFEEALNMIRNERPNSHATVQTLKAYAACDWQASEALYLDALNIQHAQENPDMIDLADTYSRLAMLDYNQTGDEKYMHWQEKSVNILESLPKDNSEQLVTAYLALAQMKKEARDWEGAESALKKMTSLLNELNNYHSRYKELHLIQFYLETQKYKEALKTLRTADIPETDHDMTYRQQAILWKQLSGWVYVMNNDYPPAKEQFKSALHLREEEIGFIEDQTPFYSRFLLSDAGFSLRMLNELLDMIVITTLMHDDASKTYYETLKSIVMDHETIGGMDAFINQRAGTNDHFPKHWQQIIMQKRIEALKTLYKKYG